MHCGQNIRAPQSMQLVQPLRSKYPSVWPKTAQSSPVTEYGMCEGRAASRRFLLCLRRFVPAPHNVCAIITPSKRPAGNIVAGFSRRHQPVTDPLPHGLQRFPVGVAYAFRVVAEWMVDGVYGRVGACGGMAGISPGSRHPLQILVPVFKIVRHLFRLSLN